jgi:hypothetical protein
VVGVLLAALVRPVIQESVHSTQDGLTALVALVFLERTRAPSWLVVAVCAAVGQWAA